MVAPTSCSCGKVNVLLNNFQDKKLCNHCYKEAKNALRDANLKKDKDAHEEAVAKKAKAAEAAEPAKA